MVSNISENNKRILKNTILLYFRQFLILGITLYTSRVILQVLGINDFGIYNVVAGVVAMMSIINSAMSVSTTRYITYELGKGHKNFHKLHKTFCISVTTYIIISFLFFLFAETLGLWFVNNKLTIPEERMTAANWVYQFSILSVIVSLMTNPYNAVIIAHEKMDAYAYVSIIEAVFKLGIVYMLNIVGADKLITYGFLYMLQSATVCLIYALYCKVKFKEAYFEFYRDFGLLKKIFIYSGWNLFGAISTMIKGQGLNILLNIFYNPAINAARAISYQINNAIFQFSSNFFTAVRPQITKYYAKEEFANMQKLVFRTSRLSFYLVLFFSLPVIIEAPYIINLWLGQLPEHVVDFVRVIIFISAVEAMQHPITSVAHATGNVARFQLFVGVTIMSILPISWFALKLGADSVSVFYISLIINIVALFIRLFLVKNLVPDFNIFKYIREVFVSNFIVLICAAIIPIVLYHYFSETFWEVILECIITIVCTISAIYLIGLESNEKEYIKNVVLRKLNMIK